MLKSVTMFLAMAVAVMWFSMPAFAEKRVALVIGNSAYEHTQPLKNPANDAQAMAAALKKIGFDTVTVSLNQKMTQLRRTLQRFGRVARRADIALVFYAGHGMEFGGKNYLVPTDARIASDQDIDFETVPLDLLMRAVEPARDLRIVILDACRNNPLAGQMAVSKGANRSLGRGLARVEPDGDTLVAYSARAGSVAEDGDGANSPYTTSLIKHISTPGLDIRVMFGRVRDSVRKRTNQRQEPFTYGSIGGSEFYLVPPKPKPVVAAPPAKPKVDQAALTYWNLIKDKDNPALFRSFLKRHPKNFLSDLARVRLDEITQARARAEAERKAAEKRAQEKRAAEKLAADKRAVEKREAEKRAAEKRAAEKLAADKSATEKLAVEKQVAAKRAAEKRAAEQLVREKRAADARARKLAEEKRGADKKAAQQREAERKAAEKLAAEKKAAEQKEARKLAALTKKKAADKTAGTAPLPRNAVELSYWDTIKSDRNPASFTAYLKRYPNGLFADLARIKLSALKQKTEKLASLPPATAGIRTPPIGSRELALALQRELKRVGCDPGALDGQWGGKGRAALMRFNYYIKLDIPATQPTPEALSAIKRRKTRVCPNLARKPAPSVARTRTRVAPLPKPTRSKAKYCPDGNMDHCRFACKRGFQRACRRLKRGF